MLCKRMKGALLLFQNNSLELSVNNYNFLRSKTRSVEFNLIEDELKELDLQLERAEHALNWNSDGEICIVYTFKGLVGLPTADRKQS